MPSKKVLIALVTISLMTIATLMVRAQAQPHPVAVTTWKTAFINDYVERHGSVNQKTGDRLISNAKILCAYLDEDPALPYAYAYGTNQLDMSSDQTVTVIELGIEYYCPLHEDLLEEGE